MASGGGSLLSSLTPWGSINRPSLSRARPLFLSTASIDLALVRFGSDYGFLDEFVRSVLNLSFFVFVVD